MRFTRPGAARPLHLAYCTNVHPGESLGEIVQQLRRFAGPVREHLGWPRLGVGLWLPRPAATALAEPAALAELRDALADQHLEVVTLNGFPYDSFHDEVVKRRVYRPDWTEDARVAYTLDLAHILARLLPDDVAEGSISTLPLGWREGWDEGRAAACRGNLEQVADGLARIEETTGRRIHLAIEPEPGCRVETVVQAAEVVADIGREHLGVCVDLAHLAVQFEDPDRALGALDGHGVGVPKAQVSSALEITAPDREAVREPLAAFAEPRFLHQVRAATADGLVGCDDLPEALGGALPDDVPWRVHFHAPLHSAAMPPLSTTQAVTAAALGHLVGEDPVTRHLEVETYTWTVLPPERRPADDTSLVVAVAAELGWVADRLATLGWEEEHP